MKICIPVNENKGKQSPVCDHFGSAPLFAIVDTESGELKMVQNQDQHHAHGMCQPLASISDQKIDAIAVNGIGLGAVRKLMASNIKVHRAGAATVDEVVKAFKAGKLEQVGPDGTCGHHGDSPHDEGGCGHAHTPREKG